MTISSDRSFACSPSPATGQLSKMALRLPVSPHLPLSPSPHLPVSPSRALLFALVLLALIGCKTTRKRVIGVVPKATSHLFWVSIQSGSMAAGHDLGVEILWNGPASETDYS